MKVKLINGQIVYAPRTIIYDNIKYIGDAPNEILVELGYKDIVEIDPPEVEEGYHVEPHWEETKNFITLNWEIIEDSPELKINQLKAKLQETDYQAIKYAEGWISSEDYAIIKAQRQLWRDQINELENKNE